MVENIKILAAAILASTVLTPLVVFIAIGIIRFVVWTGVLS